MKITNKVLAKVNKNLNTEWFDATGNCIICTKSAWMWRWDFIINIWVICWSCSNSYQLHAESLDSLQMTVDRIKRDEEKDNIISNLEDEIIELQRTL